MWLDILVYVAVFGAIGLAIYSVFKRTRNTDPDIVGYVYNGKKWVTWLFLICVLSVLFVAFIMPLPILSGQSGYHPDWKSLLLLIWVVILYACYSIIAFVPATAQEMEESKATGNTVLGTIGDSTLSVFKTILVTIGAILAALPSMISNALNPVLAMKTIGNTVYKVIGTGVGHALMGILGLLIVLVLAAMLVIFAAVFVALFGAIALGIIAIVKFFLNNVFYKKKVETADDVE
ncbi:MAG: hypothetical protein K6A28_05245 [Bacteroidales bacterium]|nr:hypothetical protein [Bacteroidales bacterium]